MSPADEARALQRIDRLFAANPHAVALARFASLAVRLDAPLLRRLRLQLLPAADASAEADLWFSALAESRDSEALVLDGGVQALLRAQLAALRLVGGASALDAAYAHTAAVHAQWPASLQLEERLTHLALGRPESHGATADATVDEAIDEALRPALLAMASNEQRALEIARWAVRAVPRLPERARRSEAAVALVVAAIARIGSGAAALAVEPAQGLPEALKWLLPTALLGKRTQLVCEPQAEALVFRAARSGDVPASVLDVPATRPVLLALSWSLGAAVQSRLVAVTLGQPVALGAGWNGLQIATLSGEAYRIDRSGPGTTPPEELAFRRACVVVKRDGITTGGVFVAPGRVLTVAHVAPESPAQRELRELEEQLVSLEAHDDRSAVNYDIKLLNVRIADLRATLPTSSVEAFIEVEFEGRFFGAHEAAADATLGLALVDLATPPSSAAVLERADAEPAASAPLLAWVKQGSEGYLVHGSSEGSAHPYAQRTGKATLQLDLLPTHPALAAIPGAGVVHDGRLIGIVTSVGGPNDGAAATLMSTLPSVQRFLRRALRPAEHDPDVFVAYAPDPRARQEGDGGDRTAQRLEACARAARVRPWFSNRPELKAGDEWAQAMLRQINGAQGAVLLFTPASRKQSLFVEREGLMVTFRRWAMPDFPCLMAVHSAQTDPLPSDLAGIPYLMLDSTDDAQLTQALRDTFDGDDAPHLMAPRPDLIEAHLRRNLAPLNLGADAVDAGIELLKHRGLDEATSTLGGWVGQIPSHDARWRSIVDAAAMLALPGGPALQTLRDAAVAERFHRAVYLNAMPVQFAHLLIRKATYPRAPMPCIDIRDPQWFESGGIEKIVAQVASKVSAALVCSDEDARWLISQSTACFALVFAPQPLKVSRTLKHLQAALPGALLVFLGSSVEPATEQAARLGIQPLALEPPLGEGDDLRWVHAYKTLLNQVAPRGTSDSTADNPTVFVSAVFDGMQESQFVVEALRAQGMNADPHNAAKAAGIHLGRYFLGVEVCAAFIGIVEQRYGHIPRDRKLNPEGHSLLELAYEQARRAKLPCLMFFKAPDPNDVASGATDTDTRQVAAFRSRVLGEMQIAYRFTTPDDLREQLRVSLAQLRNELDARAAKARPTQRRAAPKAPKRRAPPK